MSSSSDASSTEERDEDPEERLRVFQAKVIEKVQSQKSGDDDVCTHPKKPRLQANQGQKSDEYCRERDALEIQRQHEEFIDTQAKKAEQYVKRKRRLMTVSSNMPVVDAADQPRHGMEGKGPRVVPQLVKNHRKRLKKKAKHQKHANLVEKGLG